MKVAVLAVAVITVGLIAAIFLQYRRSIDTPRQMIAAIPKGVDLSIADIHQTATRDGKKEWQLDADSAQVNTSAQTVTLKNLSMIFFLENRGELHLNADSGVLLTESKDLTVEGNVVLESNGSRLVTDKLDYRNLERLITTDRPVEITGESFRLEAESLSMDLTNNRAVLKGNVSGSFSEDISL
jgi:LPS export ABC transporter protein LptC